MQTTTNNNIIVKIRVINAKDLENNQIFLYNLNKIYKQIPRERLAKRERGLLGNWESSIGNNGQYSTYYELSTYCYKFEFRFEILLMPTHQ